VVGFSKKFFHFGSRANKSVGIHRSAILGKELYTSPASRPATKAPVGRGVELRNKKIVNLRRQQPSSHALSAKERESEPRGLGQTSQCMACAGYMYVFLTFQKLYPFSFYLHSNVKNNCPCSLNTKILNTKNVCA